MLTEAIRIFRLYCTYHYNQFLMIHVSVPDLIVGHSCSAAMTRSYNVLLFEAIIIDCASSQKISRTIILYICDDSCAAIMLPRITHRGHVRKLSWNSVKSVDDPRISILLKDSVSME